MDGITGYLFAPAGKFFSTISGETGLVTDLPNTK
jgi:hypothetical protein